MPVCLRSSSLVTMSICKPSLRVSTSGCVICGACEAYEGIGAEKMLSVLRGERLRCLELCKVGWSPSTHQGCGVACGAVCSWLTWLLAGCMFVLSSCCCMVCVLRLDIGYLCCLGVCGDVPPSLPLLQLLCCWRCLLVGPGPTMAAVGRWMWIVWLVVLGVVLEAFVGDFAAVAGVL